MTLTNASTIVANSLLIKIAFCCAYLGVIPLRDGISLYVIYNFLGVKMLNYLGYSYSRHCLERAAPWLFTLEKLFT